MVMNIYDYSECDEIADNMTELPTSYTFDDCLRQTAMEMPGENPAGTIVNNVAWARYQALCARRDEIDNFFRQHGFNIS
jgi:hypothetical protein